MKSQGEIRELIDELGQSLKSDSICAEPSLRTVGTADLAQAVLAGVELQNHGWGHLNPQVLSEKERAAEVMQNEEYLSRFRRAITPVFAPPFGYCAMHAMPEYSVLLANRGLAPSYQQGNIINRGDLVLTAASRNKRDEKESVAA